jgi:hypothetical protein
MRGHSLNKAINDKVRLYAKVGSALVAAREQGRDPYAAIEAVISWENFSASVREAEQLAPGGCLSAFDCAAWVELLELSYSKQKIIDPELRP